MNTNVRALVIVITIIVGAVIFAQWPDQPYVKQKPSTTVVPKQPQRRAEYVPTTEDQIWIKQNLTSVLDKAAVSYPVENVRVQIADGMKKVLSGETKMNIDGYGHPSGTALASAQWKGQQRLLVWYYPKLKTVFETISLDRAQYEDQIVVTFLHELFHLYHQPPYVPGEKSDESMVEDELETWWWVMEKVVIPMRQHGRYGGRTSETMYVAHRAFMAAKGDPTSLAWRSIGNQLFVTAEP